MKRNLAIGLFCFFALFSLSYSQTVKDTLTITYVDSSRTKEQVRFFAGYGLENDSSKYRFIDFGFQLNTLINRYEHTSIYAYLNLGFEFGLDGAKNINSVSFIPGFLFELGKTENFCVFYYAGAGIDYTDYPGESKSKNGVAAQLGVGVVYSHFSLGLETKYFSTKRMSLANTIINISYFIR